MTEERKPAWSGLAALLVALPVLYVLSDGPAWWLARQSHTPDWVCTAYRLVYGPVIFAYYHGPGPFHDAIEWHDNLWSRLGVE
jgi:hypothetical protein